MSEELPTTVEDPAPETSLEDSFATQYLRQALHQSRRLKSLADRAVAQIDDREFFVTLDREANSVAILIKHLAGNMRSRWSDPFVSDGESERDRDGEFRIKEGDTKATIAAQWEAGWQCLFDAIASFSAEDLCRTVYIRGRAYSVMQAISRQLAHYAYHVGQIVFLAKHLKSSDWHSLSVPRGQSKQFDAAMRGGHKP